MWSQEYWAKKGDVDLFMWRKRRDDPAEGGARPVFFLVHGSSFSGPSGFDMQIEGRDYSLMDHFAELGFDVWTLDHEGYGRSSRTDSNSDIASGAADLEAGMAVVERETGRKRYAFYGQSSGALRAALFAQLHPQWVERLILDAFVWTGKDAPTLIKRREKLEEYRNNNTRPVDRDFFHSIFNRDKPGTSESIVPDKLTELELRHGDRVPTGTYLDMCANLPVVDPEKIDCPLLIVRGEFDGIATEDDLIAFWSKLPNKEKQFVILTGMAHVAPLSINRHRFWHVVESFLTLPPRRDAQ
ncbi:MAG TPA: alpha/beta hydrolase [Kiloniellales bacterium]|nr:alpha/beta hydrolase [Kiloniellales bacterium]